MALIVDAGPLVALADGRDARHEAVRAVVESTHDLLVLSPFVLAEAHYLISRDLGMGPELALLEDVASGDIVLEPMTAEDVRRAAAIVDRYRDLDVGLADASVVLLCDRHATRHVLTFDERHFRSMRTLRGEPFVVLPSDADS